MDFKEYQEKASRTMNPKLNLQDTIYHAALTISTEAGEVLDIYKKKYQGHPVDVSHVLSEVGDVLWGCAALCSAYGFSLDDVAENNIKKLLKRYPNGFEEDRSLHREAGDI